MSLIDELDARYAEVADIGAAISLLQWDQEVNMPPKGAQARAEHLATLSAHHHRLFTSDEVGKLLADLTAQEEELTPDERARVSETLHDYGRATKLPEAFVREFAEAQSTAYHAWVNARASADFSQFQPHMEKIVELSRQKAEHLGYEGSPYNALIEDFERGMTAEKLHTLFADLAERQSALVARIMEAEFRPDVEWTKQQWDEQAQWAFSKDVLVDMGYDFEAGRLDKSVHPFSTNFDLRDVRITTRVDPRDPFSCLTGSMHEGGHALYEQGFREEDRRTVLAQGISLGIHESQSRMWENFIGRSQPFWRGYFDAFRAHFPGQLDGISPEHVYRAINRVKPSLIRVEADECTYNLHIILRFEIELGLIEGNLDVADVPEAWNTKMRDYLGLDVPNDASGCLQDIHWSHGALGYFPTYALGNLYAAQLFEQIEQDLPDLWGEVESGDFSSLLGWLREHVHRVGRCRLAPELIQDITGQAPSAEPFMRYLNRKFGALYSFDAG